jgi:hypothetical protein
LLAPPRLSLFAQIENGLLINDMLKAPNTF